MNVTFCLSLTLYSRYGTGESPEQVASLSVADTWITHLAFSTWDSVHPGYCKISRVGILTIKILSISGEGYLAYGTSDGSVGLVKISQALLEEDGFSFVPKYNVKVDLVHHRSQMVYESQNLAGITAMKWIKIVGRNVYSDSIIATEKYLSHSIAHPRYIQSWSNQAVVSFLRQSSNDR